MLKNPIEDLNCNSELEAQPLACQVAGHSFKNDNNSLGMMSVKGGIVLKPIQNQIKGKREIDFYEMLQNPQDSVLKELKNFVPAFYGTTELTVKEQRVQWLVLEDLCRNIANPCIMDIKIGRQTWDPLATAQKQLNEMSKYAASKRDMGFCIPGFQVYDLLTEKLHRYDDKFGKSLDGAGVQESIRQFLNGQQGFCRNLLLQFLAQLWQILRWWRTQTRFHIFGSSLLLVYDAAKLKEEFQNVKKVNGVQKATIARQLSLRIPTGPLTPGFEVKKRSPSSSRPATPTAGSSHSPKLSDLNDAFDNMCKTHSLENNYEKDLASMKENYSVVLKDLLHDQLRVESWVKVKMIDFAHFFPANSVDKNYIGGLENLVNLFENFFMAIDS